MKSHLFDNSRQPPVHLELTRLYFKPKVIYIYIYIYIHTHTQVSPTANQTPNTPKPDRPQDDGPTARVIAQQYSPAPLSHSRKEKFGARFKNVIPFFFLLFFKLRRSKIVQLETAQVAVCAYMHIMKIVSERGPQFCWKA